MPQPSPVWEGLEMQELRKFGAFKKVVRLEPCGVRRLRALFISDVHLGAAASSAESLLDFLRHHEAPKIYLVGDIVDVWALKRARHWPQAHNDVVQKLLRLARKGTEIIYIPGNHDEFVRQYEGFTFGEITVALHAIHIAADGRRYLVTHGDQFDVTMSNARWLVEAAGHAYDLAVVANRALARIQRKLNLPPWSLARWMKQSVKDAVAHIGKYEQALVQDARKYEAEGVICGHIHHAANHHDYGLHYINCGDWVEDCTAVAELDDGSFEIIDWTEHRCFHPMPLIHIAEVSP
jgi:UDP-2,3-diacylglucosamine pyrophosphatase LpxH